MAQSGWNIRSEVEAMEELAKQMWERYFKQKVVSDLLNHSLDGYRAEVESNNADGTLTVIRPFDEVSMTLKCPPALATSAQAGDQVLVVTLGDMSNAFILCKTDLTGLGGGGGGGGGGGLRPTDYDFGHVDDGNYFVETVEGDLTTQYNLEKDEYGRIVKVTDATDGFETLVDWGDSIPWYADVDAGVYYGTCTTAAATKDKYAYVEGVTELTDGLKICVYFRYGQTYNGTATLDVNGLGAKPIYWSANDATVRYEWAAYAVKILVYIASPGVWAIVGQGHATTSYYGLTKLSSSTSSTSTSVAATPAAVKAAYDLANSKQSAIDVSGILKGDGAGGVSAAAAGTDYQAPLVAGTDYATPAMIPSVPDPSDATPQSLGTAAAGSSGDYSRADHVHGMPSASDVGALAVDGTAAAASTLAAQHSISGDAGWYAFAELALSAFRSLNVVLLISDTYDYPVGVLTIRFNRNSAGVNQPYVRWLASTIELDDVRYISDSSAGTLTLYIKKGTIAQGHLNFRVMLATDRAGAAADLTGSWLSTPVSEPTAASVPASTIKNNAATATKATSADNDGDGNSIAGTYARAAQLAKVLSDPAGVNAAVGEYVSYNGGLYTVNTAITSDMAASVFASYLDAVSDGGLNALDALIDDRGMEAVYSCYNYRATNTSTITVQLRPDCVTDGTEYRVNAPMYLIDYNSTNIVTDEYYITISNTYPSRFSRITNNNTDVSISSLSLDVSTGVLTITLSGARRYMAADVRIRRTQI